MDPLVVLAISLLVMAILPLLFLRSRKRIAQPDLQPAETAGTQEPLQAPTSTSTTRRMRRRPAPSVASTSANVADDDAEEAEPGYYVAKASKKKEMKKQEKEERRQAEAAALDHRKEKQERQAEMRRQKDEEREAEERKKEEEMLREKAKQEAAAAEDFEKWKGSFSVENEGTAEEAEQQAQALLGDFVDYIKKHKCVDLEELAAEFNLRTQDCISRVQSLEQMGRISGVMDDRGKFIYISPEEMRAVADYIKRMGRVSIAHLASKSNQFIDLEPKDDVTSLSLKENMLFDIEPQSISAV